MGRDAKSYAPVADGLSAAPIPAPLAGVCVSADQGRHSLCGAGPSSIVQGLSFADAP